MCLFYRRDLVNRPRITRLNVKFVVAVVHANEISLFDPQHVRQPLRNYDLQETTLNSEIPREHSIDSEPPEFNGINNISCPFTFNTGPSSDITSFMALASFLQLHHIQHRSTMSNFIAFRQIRAGEENRVE